MIKGLPKSFVRAVFMLSPDLRDQVRASLALLALRSLKTVSIGDATALVQEPTDDVVNVEMERCPKCRTEAVVGKTTWNAQDVVEYLFVCEGCGEVFSAEVWKPKTCGGWSSQEQVESNLREWAAQVHGGDQ